MEEKTIFREKSVERVSSPEQLDSYLKVTSPSVWVILIAIIILLVGILCWGLIGKIETSVDTSCYIEKGDLYCYTTEDIAKRIDVGTVIKLNGDEQKRYEIYSINYLGQISANELNFAHMISAEIKDHVYELRALTDQEDNFNMIYGKIVIETISPIKFVFN